MKLFTTVLAVVAFAVSSYAVPTEYSLKTDIQDIRRLIPENEVRALALDYLVNDKEFPELVVYLKGNDFQQFWNDVLAQRHIQEIVDYCEKHNVDAIEVLNLIASILGLPAYPSNSIAGFESRRTGGIAGYFKDVEALMPHEEIRRTFQQKYKTSTEFRGLMDLLDLTRFETFMKITPSAQKFVIFMQQHNVDTTHYMQLLRELVDEMKRE